MAQQSLTQQQFSIVQLEGLYVVGGLMLPNGEYGYVGVLQQVLGGSWPRTRAVWQEYKRQTRWGPGSAPLVTAVLTALYEHQDIEGVEELRKLFAGDFGNNWMMTSTGVTYRAEGPDVVTHDAGTPDERALEARLVGPKGPVNAEMSDALQALLGTGDTGRISAVYKWVTGHEPHLWRLTERPSGDTNRSLVMGNVLGGFKFIVDYGFYDGPARGLVVARQI